MTLDIGPRITMEENRVVVREKLIRSRIIAFSFIAELLKRKTWRERLHRIRAVHTLALAEFVATVQWAREYVALAVYLQEPVDQFSNLLRESRIAQAEQVLSAVLLVHRGHLEQRPFRIDCIADENAVLEVDRFIRTLEGSEE